MHTEMIVFICNIFSLYVIMPNFVREHDPHTCTALHFLCFPYSLSLESGLSLMTHKRENVKNQIPLSVLCK